MVSGHLPPGYSGSTVNWAALAQSNTTLVIMMGVAALPQITEELIRSGAGPGHTGRGHRGRRRAGRASRPYAARSPTSPGSPLPPGIQPPAITVIGAVAGLASRPVR